MAAVETAQQNETQSQPASLAPLMVIEDCPEDDAGWLEQVS